MLSHSPLRGYKTICSTVSAMYILFGGSMVARGARTAMEQFGLPEAVLSSAYFSDFFHFTFVHMIVIGVLLGLLGLFVGDGLHQRIIARVLCALELHYTYLDFRTSDSPLGNGLYRGPASLVPSLIDFAVLLAFAYLATQRVHSEH